MKLKEQTGMKFKRSGVGGDMKSKITYMKKNTHEVTNIDYIIHMQKEYQRKKVK